MEETYSIKKAIIFVIVILIIFGAFYGITILLTEKKSEKENEINDEPYVAIQYEEIIVGNIFKQNENEYYVLATTSKDSNATTYNSSLKEYAAADKAIKSYTIDLDSGFNKKYVAEESNFNLEFPVFRTSTLLKIVDKQIVETYEGENITKALETLNNSVK